MMVGASQLWAVTFVLVAIGAGQQQAEMTNDVLRMIRASVPLH